MGITKYFSDVKTTKEHITYRKKAAAACGAFAKQMYWMSQRHWFARFRRKTCVVSRCIRMIVLTVMLYAKFHVNAKFDYACLCL